MLEQELHEGLMALNQAFPDRVLISDVAAAAQPERTVQVRFERLHADAGEWKTNCTQLNSHTLKVGLGMRASAM
mgnify:FL=1